MENIEARILSYHQLSDEDRQAIESYVEAHPEWEALLRDVKALEALAEETSLLHGEAPLHDDLLAYYVISQHVDSPIHSPALQSAFERVEKEMERDSEVQARAETYQQRLEATLDTVDPVAHFERLSGHSLAESFEVEPAEEETTAERVPSPDRAEYLGWLMQMPRAFQWALASVAVLGLLYGALFMVSTATQSDIDRLAALQPEEIQLEGYEVRLRGGGEQAQSSPDALYRRALARLNDAQVTTLGLFPRYDASALEEAQTLLQQVVDREEAGSFLQLEAHYFLGKVRLAQGDPEAARPHFKTVVKGDGRMTQEAATILRELQRVAPTEKGAESYFGPDRLPTGSEAPDA